MATSERENLRDRVQEAWSSAVDSFESLKQNGKINQAQWDQLQSYKDPKELLTDIESGPYAKTESTKKLLGLAKTSVNAVLRFDDEIANIAQGISGPSFGISSAAWGALKIVLHISQDIFQNPEVLVEIVAKIFVFMPRIDLYFELFYDQQDVLNIQSLLVSLYKNIIAFNLTSLRWYSKPKINKVVRSFIADPREQFQNIFKQMSDTSMEMKERVESINLKSQKDRHQEMLEEFRKLELTQQRHMDELRSAIIAKNQDIVTKYQADAKERQNLAEAAKIEAAEKEKRERHEALRPYNKLSQLRAALWEVLHKSPWTVIAENSISGFDDPEQVPPLTSWQSWEKGQYISQYPVEDDLSDITLAIDWKPMNDPEKPLIRWMINVPNSIYYPGRHLGRMEIKKASFALGGMSVFDVASSRIRIFWESPILSPLPSADEGFLSSTGPLEETSVPLVLTRALQSIAHHLIHGPFPTQFPCPLPWHPMNHRVNKYFNKKTTTCKEEGMRATAFFANAFTRDLEGLDNLGGIGLLSDCKQASVMAIQELASFYEIEGPLAEDTKFKDVSKSFDFLYDQQEWVQEDRKWAIRIAELAGLRPLALAAKQLATTLEAAKKLEIVNRMTERVQNSALLSAAEVSSLDLQKYSEQSSDGNKGPFAGDGLPKEWSPLHRAVWREDLVAVLCLATKYTVKVTDARGCTPLHLACTRRGSLLFLTQYCRRYCDTDEHHFCFPGRTYLPLGADPGRACQMAAALIEAGADPNAKALGDFPFTPMHCIANSGWVDVAYLLLENGGSAFSSGTCSPYCWADDIYPTRMHEQMGMTNMRKLLEIHLCEAQMREINDRHRRLGWVVAG